jgi:hypothetical protein
MRDTLVFIVILSVIVVAMFALFFWNATMTREAEEDWVAKGT